ncbi:MAG: hypothetical protein QM754_21740 [Tepidisphaeraceae bacterium]
MTSANWRRRWRAGRAGRTRIGVALTGIAHLRGHETDRLAALCTEINRLGGDCRETDDGLVITATALHGRHLAVRTPITGWRWPARSSGCGWPGVEIEDIGTTAKTLPDFPGMWTAMLARSPGVRPAIRRVRRQGSGPARASRPRTKTRPEHADAEAAMVVTVDRGRWGCVLDGDPDRPVTAMRARELGRTPIVVGDDIDVVGDLSGRPDTLARIVRRGDTPNGIAAHRRRHRPHRTGGGRQRRSAADRGGTGRPATAHRLGRPGLDRRLRRRAVADPVPDQNRPGRHRIHSPSTSPTWI